MPTYRTEHLASCPASRATLASSPSAAGTPETDPYFVLDFCEGAIRDAITLEDGLDAGAGQAVLEMIDRAKRVEMTRLTLFGDTSDRYF